MDTSELLNYLSIVIELERDKYVQNAAIVQIDKSISAYVNEFNTNTSLNQKAEAARANINYNNIKPDEKGKGFMYFMVYYVGFFGAATGIPVYFFSDSILPALIVGAVGAFAGGCIPVAVWKHILKKRKERAMIQINRGLRAEDSLVTQRSARNINIASAVPKLRAERKTMKDTYDLTCQALQKCYAVDIIPKGYRSMVPVCMFYDYISNGRTYSIRRDPARADEGAINMYKQECFQNLIIAKFDQILNQLDEIKSNQVELYNTVREGNRITHDLLRDINSNISKVNSNMTTIKYQNDCRNACLERMSYVADHYYYTHR